MSLIQPNIEKYQTGRAASGAKTQHNGDTVAQALYGMEVEEVKDVALAMGVEDVAKYDALNPGQIRMNLGNRIRGRVTAIDKENARLEAAAEKEDATAADRKAAKNLKSGEEVLESITKPMRKAVDARLAQQEKERAERKASQSETAKANLAKGRAKAA